MNLPCPDVDDMPRWGVPMRHNAAYYRECFYALIHASARAFQSFPISKWGLYAATSILMRHSVVLQLLQVFYMTR